jgi:hypothetical protein
MNQIQIIDDVEVNTAARINAHESSPTPVQEPADFDPANQPTITRDAKGNIVIMQGGKVVGTLQRAKKLSYAKGVESKFQEKRKQAYLAKQAKQA